MWRLPLVSFGFIYASFTFLKLASDLFRLLHVPSASFSFFLLPLASFGFVWVSLGSFGYLRVASVTFGPPSAEGEYFVKFLRVSKPAEGLNEAEGGHKMRPGTPKVVFPCTIETGGPWLAPLARGTWGPP